MKLTGTLVAGLAGRSDLGHGLLGPLGSSSHSPSVNRNNQYLSHRKRETAQISRLLTRYRK
jgi:hypothetical protein